MSIIVLQGITAIEAWDTGICKNAHPVEQLDLSRCASCSAELEPYRSSMPSLTRPLHIAVAENAARRKSRFWNPHVAQKQFPKNSFYELEKGIYVEAPYLCFARLASTLPLPLACMLGMEFCGAYSSLAFHEKQNRLKPGKGYLERPALTSVTQLKRYADALGLGRKSMAQRACSIVANRSRSPRESIMHLLTHMKPLQGGYDLSGYELNQRIPIPPEIGCILGVDDLEVDMSWTDFHLALEYDGKDYHDDDIQRTYDNVRRSILRKMGISVLTIDKHQMKDMAVMDGVMQIVADAVGGPSVRQDDAARSARIALRAQLLAPDMDLYHARTR